MKLRFVAPLPYSSKWIVTSQPLVGGCNDIDYKYTNYIVFGMANDAGAWVVEIMAFPRKGVNLIIGVNRGATGRMEARSSNIMLC